MSGNKTKYMIFEKIIVYSKQICESDKTVHEILENIEKTQRKCKFVVDEICFKSLKVCRATASSLPWDLPCRLHCDHVDIAYVRVLSHTYLARV